MSVIKETKLVESKGTNSYSFSLQYIALMLIVLCFVLGSVTRQKIKNYVPKVEVAKEVVEEVDPTTEAIVFNNLFEAGKTTFIADGIEALDLLLASHDIAIEIKVGEEDSSAHMKKSELAIARSVALHKHFEAIGIPASAINIYTVPKLLEGQIQFILTKLEEG